MNNLKTAVESSGRKFEVGVAVLEANATIEETFCEYCGGNDDVPQGHCADCERPIPASKAQVLVQALEDILASKLTKSSESIAQIAHRALIEYQRN